MLRPVVSTTARPSPNWHFASGAAAPAAAPAAPAAPESIILDSPSPSSPTFESFDLTVPPKNPLAVVAGTAEADAAGLAPLLALTSNPALGQFSAHLASALEAYVSATAPVEALPGLTPAQRLLFLFASPALAGTWASLGDIATTLGSRLAVRDEKRIHAWGASQATSALVSRYRDEVSRRGEARRAAPSRGGGRDNWLTTQVGSFVTAYDTVDALVTDLASDNEQYALAVLTTYVDARLAAGYTRDTASRQLSFVQQSVRRYIAVFAAARERYAFAVLTW
ncbi:uncharacterized protein LOC62_03G005100 [Vanrija pseudolonga]|uniref:Uncharacterized protein n=1 Tax=Vanrija pseudolonga TaxID=143232 RepID=A0AAF0YDM4_9TREE|nr:hypothetical protein LOC62_03G005100 [Vanrija pseudolonga]